MPPSADSSPDFSWSFAQETRDHLALPPLEALSGYEAVRELGRGATARVLEVRERASDERLALKLLETKPAPTAAELERFRRGASLQQRLQHPGIQRVYAWGGQAPELYLLAELLPGGTLGERIEREGPLSSAHAIRLGLALSAALRYAHGEGVVHRDLKPDNVLFAADGRPVLIDFGLARAAADAPPLTRTGDLVGTPAFMAPEQTRPGPIGPEADAYALGALLYHALSGELPIELAGAASLLEVLERIATRPPPPLPAEVPAPLREVVGQLLRKDRAARWSLERAEEALRRAGEGVVGRTGAGARTAPSAPPSSADSTRARSGSGSGSGPSGEGAALRAFCQAAEADFVLLGVLGRGGMGLVLRARERVLGREVALKVLQHMSAQSAERFAREAQLTARLDHPGIVRVHRAGRYGGMPFIAFEQVEGRELSEVLPELPRERRLDVVGEVALALGHAHAAGVVHRDLKPSNVMLDPSGRARVLDFGVARASDLGTLTRSGAMVGTPRYSSPEQFDTRLEITPATDVWALGVLLYECLTDEPPFPATTWIELAQRVASADLTPPRRLDPTISPGLEAVCLRALRVEASARYADGAAFAADLARARAGEAPEASGSARPRASLAALALVVLGLILALAWAAGPGEDAPASPPDEPTAQASGSPSPPGPPAALQLTREPLALRAGLCAHPLGALEVPSEEVGLAAAEPRLVPQRVPRWRYLDPGPALYRFDPATLELLAARRLEGEGPVLLSASQELAVSARRRGAVQLWALPALTPLARCQPPPPLSALALSASAGRLLVSSGEELRCYELPELRLRWTRSSPATRALRALPERAGFLLTRGRGESARLERWSWAGERVAEAECPSSEGLQVTGAGAWAMTYQRKPPRVQRWRLDPAGLTLVADLPLGSPRRNVVLCLPDAAAERVLTGGAYGRLGWVDLLSGARQHTQPANLALEAGARRGERAWLGARDCLIRGGDFSGPWPHTSAPETHEGPIVTLSEWGVDCEFPLHRFLGERDRAARGVPTAVDRDERQAVYALPVAEQVYGTVLTWRPRPGTPASDLPAQVHLRPRAVAIRLLPRPREALLASLDGGLYLWRDEALAQLRPPPAPDQEAEVQTLALACDALGAAGYSADEGGAIERWDLTLTSKPPTVIRELSSPVLSLALDSRRLCAGEAGGEVSLFGLPEHTFEARLPGSSGVVALALAGERLLAGHLDGALRLWDLGERRLVGEARLPDLDFARSLLAEGEAFRVGTQLGRVYRLELP